MNEVHERALECYIKKLEKDNKTLRSFANDIRGIIFNFDAANPDKSDKDTLNDIISLIRMYECDFEED